MLMGVKIVVLSCIYFDIVVEKLIKMFKRKTENSMNK